MFKSNPIDNINLLIHETIKNDDQKELSKLLPFVKTEKITGYYDNLNYLLLIASIHSSFESMKFLLLSPQLTDHANINTRNDQVFKNACRMGSLDILKFILDNPQLKRIVDKETTIKTGLLEAAKHNQLEIFKYFVHDYKFERKINLKNHYLKCLITAYERENYPKEEDEIMSYIVLNISIPKSKRLMNYIDKNNAVELRALFEKREFNESFHCELNINKENKKKMKV